MKSFTRFIATLLIAILVAVPAAVTVAPHKTYALFGLGDIVHDPINYIVNGLTSVAAGSLVTKEYALDNIAWIVSKIALQSVIRSTVNWINSGFNGSPAFVTDLKENLLNVGDAVANQFLTQYTNNLAINSPFKDVIGQAVLANYYLSTARDGFFLKNPYTLDQVSQDAQAFTEGDFDQGGFAAQLNTFLYPQNNPLGAYELTKDALDAGVTTQEEQRKTELDWGNGFLSWRGDCVQDAVSQAEAQDAVSLAEADNCVNQRIETPGSWIIDSAKKAGFSSIDQLVNADELNEVIGALVGQLLTKTLGGGGLRGASEPTAGGGGSYINQATQPTQYTSGVSGNTGTTGNNNLNNSFLNTIANNETALNTYIQQWQKIQGAANGAKQALQGSTCVADSATIISSQIDPTIQKSQTEITRANAALQQLGNIRSQMLASQASGSTNSGSAVSTATSQYQQLLASPTMPSSSDFTYAQEQSSETGSQTPSSLYTQMNNYAAQAQCTSP